MSTQPVGKCVNFRLCPKADSREAIPLAPRDADPVCPSCGQPLLVSTPVVNPRRNALFALAILAVLLLGGAGFALKHFLTKGSAAAVSVPTTKPAPAVAAASPEVAASSLPPAAGPSVAAGSPSSAVASPSPAVPRPAARAVGSGPGAVASTPVETASPGKPHHTVAVPADAPAYSSLVKSADKLDTALHFKRGSGLLDDGATRDLTRLASVLKSAGYRNRKVLVAGFADNTGEPEFSKYLSAKRAQIVVAELTAQGVPVAQTFGFGQIAPIGDNATREGRERNRRVEIFVAR
jgi:outer membrane protein OmpA-like peptidoglycan-associated protein